MVDVIAADSEQRWGKPRRARFSVQWGLTREGLLGLLRFRFELISAAALLALAGAGVAVGLIVLALATPGLLQATLGEVSSWKLAIAAAIYLIVWAYGSWHLLTGVGRLQREADVLGQFADKLHETFPAHQEVFHADVFGPRRKTLLAPVAALRGVPLAETATHRMQEIIRDDAERHRFDPLAVVTERVSDQLLSGSAGIRDAQQLGVRLGILVTFVGIVASLQGVSGMMSGDVLGASDIRNSIRAVVLSLGLAFSSSIAGLSAAIVFQVIAGALRSAENRLVDTLYQVGSEYQAICRLAMRDDDLKKLEVSLKDHRQAILDTADDIRDGARVVEQATTHMGALLSGPAERMDEVSARLADAVRRQEAAAGALAQAADALGAFGASMAAAQQRFAETLLQAVKDLDGHLVGEFKAGRDATLAERMEASVDRQDAVTRRLGFWLLAVGLVAGAAALVAVASASGLGGRLLAWMGG
ncbi:MULTISPECIES: hypothetical protein [unclassified Xanthobacter]|uniref:hypothetical protein n=1 Tax=unclassified Xanthobacter TaxID=2623496 RepID=UPI001EE07863|nr:MULTISPECIES: hypothetical protein [unclassified Xanthobacter]